MFTGVAGFLFTLSRHCSVEQVDAYDELHVVDGSPWLAGLPRSKELLHYRIYFDDIGCYEVLAAGFTPPARAAATHARDAAALDDHCSPRATDGDRSP